MPTLPCLEVGDGRLGPLMAALGGIGRPVAQSALSSLAIVRTTVAKTAVTMRAKEQ